MNARVMITNNMNRTKIAPVEVQAPYPIGTDIEIPPLVLITWFTVYSM